VGPAVVAGGHLRATMEQMMRANLAALKTMDSVRIEMPQEPFHAGPVVGKLLIELLEGVLLHLG